MNTKHTPGPWSVSTAPGCVDIRGPNLDRNFIASVDVDKGMPLVEIDANARLIAAAPELLAALRTIAARLDAQAAPLPTDYRRQLTAIADAAIAKAEGK